MTTTVKIVGAILDKGRLTLYKDTGHTIVIEQGDPRLAPLVETIIPEIRANKFAIVNLDNTGNPYASYEDKSNGFVRFFRVGRAFLSKLLGGSDETTQVGSIPSVLPLSDKQVVAEIMANATPSTSAEFTVQGVQNLPAGSVPHGDTVVAVTKDNRVIPEVQNIHQHINHAVESNTLTGTNQFMERISKVINNRKHSVDDLLRFMKHGDLPIADDGTIIAYKLLRRQRDNSENYVDVHSGRVVQRVGSRVFMDEKLVDDDRRNDCSQGLHVAQRSYLSGFEGDVCVLVKIYPEDVIAVPQYSTNKMRVSGYEILAELKPASMKALKDKKPVSLPEDVALLTRALRNTFPPYDQCVEITAAKGGGLKIYPRKGKPSQEDPSAKPKEAVFKPLTTSEGDQVADVGNAPTAAPVNPVAVAQAVEADKVEKPKTRAEKAKDLFTAFEANPNAETAKAVLEFKKKSKVGWSVLGLDSTAEEKLTKHIAK